MSPSSLCIIIIIYIGSLMLLMFNHTDSTSGLNELKVHRTSKPLTKLLVVWSLAGVPPLPGFLLKVLFISYLWEVVPGLGFVTIIFINHFITYLYLTNIRHYTPTSEFTLVSIRCQENRAYGLITTQVLCSILALSSIWVFW